MEMSCKKRIVHFFVLLLQFEFRFERESGGEGGGNKAHKWPQLPYTHKARPPQWWGNRSKIAFYEISFYCILCILNTNEKERHNIAFSFEQVEHLRNAWQEATVSSKKRRLDIHVYRTFINSFCWLAATKGTDNFQLLPLTALFREQRRGISSCMRKYAQNRNFTRSLSCRSK